MKMIRALHMISFVVLAVLFSCNSGNESPNIILVVVDDLGAHDVGFMGSAYYETPNIDGLAANGMVFTQAYAAAAICSPTRASIMTGKSPARLGITDWIRPTVWRNGSEDAESYVGSKDKMLLCPHYPLKLDTSEVTIAELFKSEGYVTMHIGKWHLGGQGNLPEDQGFDYNFGGCDFGQPPSYYAPYTSNWAPGGIPGVLPENMDEYITDREAIEAEKFIRSNKDKPFFLNLWHYAVHTPIQPKEEYLDHFKVKASDSEQKNAKYAAMISSVDDAMGTILTTLEEEGILDNSIVVFFSDNGGHNGYTSNKPLRSGKGNPWEGGIREPMVIHWPEHISPGSTFDQPVSSIDLLPTLSKLAGIEFEKYSQPDGIDISSAFLDNPSQDRNDLFWHFPHYRGYEDVRPYSIIRSGDWKMIRFWEGRTELYNLVNDPSESENVADKHQEKINELNNKLDFWLKETGAKMPKLNPDYEGNI